MYHGIQNFDPNAPRTHLEMGPGDTVEQQCARERIKMTIESIKGIISSFAHSWVWNKQHSWFSKSHFLSLCRCRMLLY